jgi:hypothetical protein
MRCKLKSTDLIIINLPKALWYRFAGVRSLFRPRVMENDAALPYGVLAYPEAGPFERGCAARKDAVC